MIQNLDVAIKIGIVPAGLKQLFCRMVMNVAAGNVDNHNKKNSL